jgi:hypothetical protein
LLVKEIAGAIRKSYIHRIENDVKQSKNKNKFSLGNLSKNGPSRTESLHFLQNKIPFEIGDEENAKRILESVFSLEKGQYDKEYVKLKQFEIFEKHYPFEKGNGNYLFRDSITYLDYIER